PLRSGRRRRIVVHLSGRAGLFPGCRRSPADRVASDWVRASTRRAPTGRALPLGSLRLPPPGRSPSRRARAAANLQEYPGVGAAAERFYQALRLSLRVAGRLGISLSELRLAGARALRALRAG